MNQPSEKLSEGQQEYLKSTIDKITEGFAELREKLIDLGWGKGDFRCKICDCELYESSSSPGGPCARPTCGHRFFSHDVF